MKIWKFALVVLLGAGLSVSFGLSGCGDDDDGNGNGLALCAPTCEKMIECADAFGGLPEDFTLDSCTLECAEGSDAADRQCAFSCDRAASCDVFAACLVDDCGLILD
jgi:hypothetical protein